MLVKTIFEEILESLQIEDPNITVGDAVHILKADVQDASEFMDESKTVHEWEVGINIWLMANISLLSYKWEYKRCYKS